MLLRYWYAAVPLTPCAGSPDSTVDYPRHVSRAPCLFAPRILPRVNTCPGPSGLGRWRRADGIVRPMPRPTPMRTMNSVSDGRTALEALQSLATELSITVGDATVWLSIGQALLFGAVCLVLGIGVARLLASSNQMRRRERRLVWASVPVSWCSHPAGLRSRLVGGACLRQWQSASLLLFARPPVSATRPTMPASAIESPEFLSGGAAKGTEASWRPCSRRLRRRHLHRHRGATLRLDDVCQPPRSVQPWSSWTRRSTRSSAETSPGPELRRST